MARALRGKTIIITGASSGIGAATAVACAGAGMNVVISARREDRLRVLAERIGADRSEVVPADVADAGSSARLLEAAESRFGAFDAVFANAGYTIYRNVIDESEDERRAMFETNYFASVDLLQAAARRLLAVERPGHLLMCSSCLSKFSLPGHSTYAATKAAQNAVCQAMRLELRSKGIDVSSVHPITTTTELFDVSADLSGRERPKDGLPEHAQGLFVQPPERVARAVLRCLQRPRPEVWTSHVVRGVAALGTFFPRLGDFLIGRQMHDEVESSAAER